MNGAKVAESTLGTVPNSAKVAGVTLRKFNYHVFDGGPLAGSTGTSLVGQAQVVDTGSATGSPVLTINYHADEFIDDECVASGTVVIG